MSIAIPQRQIALPRFEFPAFLRNLKDDAASQMRSPLGGAGQIGGALGVGRGAALTETVLTLQPDGTAGLDTWIRQDTPTRNYGIDTVLYAGKFTGASNRRSLLRFDVSSVPVGATITSAILTVVCTAEADTSDVSVGAHRALTQWFEGEKNNADPAALQDGSTWNLRNANGAVAWGGDGGAAGTDYTSLATGSVTVTGVGSFAINITADVAAWVASTAGNYGVWLINASETTNNSAKTFASSDNTTAANRPKLVITYLS